MRSEASNWNWPIREFAQARSDRDAAFKRKWRSCTEMGSHLKSKSQTSDPYGRCLYPAAVDLAGASFGGPADLRHRYCSIDSKTVAAFESTEIGINWDSFKPE